MESNNKQQTDSTVSGQVKRTYIAGDEWLYYKIYSGPKTADLVLTEMIKPLTEQWMANNVIDYWFFIRYSDPGLHTRVRFHFKDRRNIGTVIAMMNQASNRYLEQSLINNIMLDTYQREVERYGPTTMDLGEKWFYHDSKMIVDMLSMIEGDEGEFIRWKFALRAVGALLADFGCDMEKKFELVSRFRENFGREFGLNMGLKEQLEKKFRAARAEISEIMDPKNDEVSEMLPLFQILEQKSKGVAPIVKDILALEEQKKMPLPVVELIPSYSHMMINRLFKSKQRLHELVVYDFLHRYYKSEIGRLKYSKMNAGKKKKKDKNKDKNKDNNKDKNKAGKNENKAEKKS